METMVRRTTKGGINMWEDKIRKKIKELEQENQQKSFLRSRNINWKENAEMEMCNAWAIMKLQELLEED